MVKKERKFDLNAEPPGTQNAVSIFAYSAESGLGKNSCQKELTYSQKHAENESWGGKHLNSVVSALYLHAGVTYKQMGASDTFKTTKTAKTKQSVSSGPGCFCKNV